MKPLEYHEALCRLGAQLTRLALARPALFGWEVS